MLIASVRSKQSQQYGRDTSVRVPVRVSSDAAETIVRIRRQKELKQLLSATPLYAALLKEYPQAHVSPGSIT